MDGFCECFVVRVNQQQLLIMFLSEVVHALALGPLGYDVELARKATVGVG